MAITASMVKELRETSGAGMMDCKKALTQCDGDMEAAIEFLRKSGAMKAEKKASRIAAEGIVLAVVDGDNKASMVEVNSETDFVAKNEKFRNFVTDVANQVLVSDAADVDALLSEESVAEAGKTVNEVLTEKIATIGEKLSVRRFEKVVTDGVVVSYIHGAGRIGVLVEADCDNVSEDVKTCLKNVAMQVAAMNPKYVSRDEVSADYIEHEKEILLAQAKADPKNASKPDQIIEKMITGRLNKELKEVCLLDQAYVQDSDMNVAQYVASVAKAAGANLSVKKFVRYECGEGIEKKQEDFAAEVAAQMNA